MTSAPTAAARNALFGYRAYLFAHQLREEDRGFCRGAWHSRRAGHFDQEEIVNPGPRERRFHQGVRVPGRAGRGRHLLPGAIEPGYKIASSAAFTGTSR